MIIEGGMFKHLFLLDSRWLEDESGFMGVVLLLITAPYCLGVGRRELEKGCFNLTSPYITYSAVLDSRVFDRREPEQV
jgi:hypothetical protein